MRVMAANLRATREDMYKDLPEDLYEGVHGKLSYDAVGRFLVIENTTGVYVVPFEHVLVMKLEPR